MALDAYLSTKLRRLSVIGMITVVYVHAFNFDDRYLWPGRPFEEAMNLPNFLQVLITNGLFRFGIPLFFLRSGFLMAETDERYTSLTRLKKRLQTLILPYLTWSMVGLSIACILESFPQTAPYVASSWLRPFNNMPIHEFNGWQWLRAVTLEPISFQLWFLRSLFVYSILYPLLVKGLEKFPLFLLIPMGLAWVLSLGAFFVEGEGLFFFSIGILISKKGVSFGNLSAAVEKAKLWWWLPVLLLFKTWMSFQNWPIAIGYFLHKGVQPALVLGIWVLYDKTLAHFSNTTWLDRLSPYNFYIYGFHVPVLYFATDFTFHILGRGDYIRGAIFLLLPLVVMGVAVLFGWLLRRVYLPAFKVFTGGRT